MGRSADARSNRCRSLHGCSNYVARIEAEGTQMTADSEFDMPVQTAGTTHSEVTSVEPVIAVDKLNIYYDKFLAVRDVTMEIAPRSITALIGPSGAESRRFCGH